MLGVVYAERQRQKEKEKDGDREREREREMEKIDLGHTQAYLQSLFMFYHFYQINKLKKLEEKLSHVSIVP